MITIKTCYKSHLSYEAPHFRISPLNINFLSIAIIGSDVSMTDAKGRDPGLVIIMKIIV